jgi:hypothetical protein
MAGVMRPGYWALTRYDDVACVSKHPEIYSSAEGSSFLNELCPRERRIRVAEWGALRIHVERTRG